ncbi:uncharacterized protein LOC144011524 isoform X2 [Festucalex cinctus]
MCYRNYCKYMSSRKLHLNTRVSEFRELFKFQHGGERRRIREWRPDNWRRVPIGSGVNRCFTIRGTGALFKERGSDGSNARGYGENVGRADGCYMPVQSSCLQDLAEDGLLLFALSGSRAAFCWFDGLSQHQVVEEDLDQGS